MIPTKLNTFCNTTHCTFKVISTLFTNPTNFIIFQRFFSHLVQKFSPEWRQFYNCNVVSPSVIRLAIADQGVTETLQPSLENHSNSIIGDVTKSFQIMYSLHSAFDDVTKTILISSSQLIYLYCLQTHNSRELAVTISIHCKPSEFT